MKIRIIDRKKEHYSFEVQKKNIFFWERLDTFDSLEKAIIFAQAQLSPKIVWESQK